MYIKAKAVIDHDKTNDSPFFLYNETVGNRIVQYEGKGWYSLDDNNIYRKGKFATFSRIYCE